MNERGIGVLEKYDLQVISTRRTRGAVLCETDRGLKLLREYRGSEKRVNFEYDVLSALQLPGNLYVDNYIKTTEGTLIAAEEGGESYTLKNWYDGEECDVKDPMEIIRGVRELAVLHKAFRQLPESLAADYRNRQGNNAERNNLCREFVRHTREMQRARLFIRGVQQKSKFEFLVMESYPAFYEQAAQAVELMRRLEPPEKLWLLHGDYTHHHILVGNRYVAIINFTRMKYGIQVWDLYHFMRKVLEKQNWNIKLGNLMLETYHKILPINAEERKYLYLLFLYPEKYWKQLNYYYNTNKAWIPQHNVDKLQSLVNQWKFREEFLENLDKNFLRP